MLHRLRSYVSQHHVALLALFVALGGTGAFAATTLDGPQVSGFSAAPANKSGVAKGFLSKLGGVTLRWRSSRAEDARTCVLTAKASGRGQLNTFYAVQPSEGSRELSAHGKNFTKPGSDDIVVASFDEGAPGISRQIEGQLTWHADSADEVVTSVFHVSAESDRCRFHGTLTGAPG
jgi:hypothetical protein